MNRRLQLWPLPAAIFQFSENLKQNNTSADDIIVEEGFNIVRKDQTVSTPKIKGITSYEATKEPPKSIKKIFGDDEV